MPEAANNVLKGIESPFNSHGPTNENSIQKSVDTTDQETLGSPRGHKHPELGVTANGQTRAELQKSSASMAAEAAECRTNLGNASQIILDAKEHLEQLNKTATALLV